jgi:hypothetical protein
VAITIESRYLAKFVFMQFSGIFYWKIPDKVYENLTPNKQLTAVKNLCELNCTFLIEYLWKLSFYGSSFRVNCTVEVIIKMGWSWRRILAFYGVAFRINFDEFLNFKCHICWWVFMGIWRKMASNITSKLHHVQLNQVIASNTNRSIYQFQNLILE